jgi:hypothetical protein
MRCELVYRAHDKVPNRFQLCRLASTSARSMIRSSVGMHLTINHALEAISGHAAPIVAQPPDADEVKAPENGPAFILDPAV